MVDSESDGAFPLTPMQEGMLFHTLSDSDSGVFLEQVTCLIHGRLDVDRFKDAWNRTVENYEALRTVFLWEGQNSPLQRVLPLASVMWREFDWSRFNADEQDARLEQFLAEDRRDGFELSRSPMMRVTLIRLAEDRVRFLWTFHHLHLDGLSIRRVINCVFAIYGSASTVVSDWSSELSLEKFVSHAGGRSAEMESYWTQLLTGFETPTRVFDYAIAHTGSAVYRRQKKTLDAAFHDSILAFASRHNLPLDCLVYGTWSYLLGTYAREDDVVFGASVSGRSADLAGIEQAVGLFINTLPVRTNLDPNMRVLDWLRGITDQMQAMQSFDQSPLASVQRWSEIPRGESLFESIVAFNEFEPVQISADSGLRIDNFECIEESNYPLALLVEAHARIHIQLVHDTGRFSPAFVERLLSQFVQTLKSITSSDTACLRDLSVLTNEERAFVLDDANRTHVAIEDGVTIQALIEEHARKKPDQVAVRFEGKQLSYAELDRRAKFLAQQLCDRGVQPNQRVGLYVERGLEMVIGILGILKARAAYVPLDPSYPQSRLEFVAEDAELVAVVTRGELVDSLRRDVQVVLEVHASESLPVSELANCDSQELANGVPSETDTVYVIYTSGSEGRPKGVLVSNRNLVNSTLARGHFYDGAVGRFLLLSSFSFDSSVAGIFWTLSSGGTLVLPKQEQEQDLESLGQLIRQEEVTHFLTLPSLYSVLLQYTPSDLLNSVEVVTVAGEACSGDLVKQHYQCLSSARLYNEYGPTEASVWCVAAELTQQHADSPVPIGRPIANTQVYVLDRQLEPVPVGVCGELFVAGEGVTLGYLNRPELTQSRFVPNHFSTDPRSKMYRTGDLVYRAANGDLHFIGRVDEQVKIRGHRIELGEIQSLLIQHDDVMDAVVVAASHAGGTSTAGSKRSTGARSLLVGYVVSDHENPSISVAELKDFLRRRLPDYSVPETLVVLDEFPRLPNGKVDRRALPDPFVQRDPGRIARPSNEAEQTLLEIWSDLLECDQLGVHDNFYEAGGDSMVSIQLISRAREAGFAIDPRQFGENPTVAGMAKVAVRSSSHPAQSSSSRGSSSLTPHQAWLLEHGTRCNQVTTRAFQLNGSLDSDDVKQVVRFLLEHHNGLNIRLEERDGVWRQVAGRVVDVESVLEEITVPASATAADAAREHRSRVAEPMSLEHGPLVRFAMVRADNDRSALLFVSALDLVVDAFSWQLLQRDLDSLLIQSSKGHPLQLPSKTASAIEWVHRLHVLCESNQNELAYWRSQLANDDAMQNDKKANSESLSNAAQSVMCSFDIETTASLVECNEAYRTKTEGLLLAAICLVLRDWTGHQHIHVDIENDGRGYLLDGMDVSRTIGQLMSMFPISFDMSDATDEATAICAVKEQLARVPHRGVSFGSLQALSSDEAVRAQLGGGHASLLFRYRVAEVADADTLVVPVETSIDEQDETLSFHQCEIDAELRGGVLQLKWTYRPELLERSTIEELVDQFSQTLHELVAHCQSPSAGGFTPSDFPLADLNQEELNRLLEEL